MNERGDMPDRAEDTLGRLWEGLPSPSEDELHALAHSASTGPQDVQVARRRRMWPRRWTVVAVGAALLAASGLGFGVGTSVTPSGSAGRNVVGFGFLPDPGWKVVQTAGANTGTTTAVASNDGVRISVRSTPRGDPVEDIAYAIRDLPVRVADAHPVAGDPARLQLRAGVGGYNLDARISFSDAPTAAMRAAAQRQLNRLVVAAARVTIGVRPAISSPTTVNGVIVFGTIDRAKEGESVTIQAKDCGTTFFRVFAGANTEADGSWSTNIFPSVTTRLRAVWNGETSAEVIFRQRVFIGLHQRGASRFRMSLSASKTRFAGKPVTIQQFDQRIGQWKAAKQVRLSATDFYNYFTLRVPKGTRLRAVFPDALAKPCYLGATSSVIRT